MATRKPLAVGEWYHCYNRGVDKRKVFDAKKDYERFLLLMYSCNSLKPFHTSDFKDTRLTSMLVNASFERGESIVEIGAYTLLPNHLHFALKETQKNGIALFMQKVFTGYTMYFNKKYDRTGALFSGTYKSKHILDDRYLKQVIPYIHCNPIELFEPRWKEGGGNLKTIEKRLLQYPYSSLLDFLHIPRLQRVLLGTSIFEYFDSSLSMRTMLKNAQDYYRETYTPSRPEV